MTITISASGITLDGPLVAGEKVAVSVSGLALSAEDKPTLALLARFPDALLASVELAEDAQTPGTWTGELDTATKQTALFFATARADERRDAALELVSGRVSLSRLTVPMANSALCPKPDGSPFASPVYVPVPGPPGQGGDPYDQAPLMDGDASAGTEDEYARGDHRHPTDTTRQAAIEDLAAIRSGAAAGATAVQPSALSAYRTASAQDAIDGAQNTAIAAKYTKPATGIPASDLAAGVIPTALPNPQPLHVGATDYDGSTEKWTPTADTNGGYGIVTLESATNSTHADGYAATPLAVKTVADSVSGKADSTSLAPAFSASSTYAVGDYVTHEGLLYKCTTAVSTAGAWNAANWTAVAVTDEMGRSLVHVAPETSQTSLGYWTVETDGLLYEDGEILFAAVHAAPPSNGGALYLNANDDGNHRVYYWDPTSGLINPPKSAWKFADIVPFMFKKKLDGTNDCWLVSGVGKIASDSTPAMNGTGTAGTSTAFARGDHVHPTDTSRAPLASPAFTGTPTAPTAAAGTNTTQIATTAFVQTEARYALTAKTPTVSGTAATVACEDRAINDLTIATGITSLTITPPAAVTGRARDFFCRVTLTDASLPTVTLSGGTIDIGASEVAGMTQGVNLLMFTEIASGHWLASRRSAP